MPIDFHDQNLRTTYTSRVADESWIEWVRNRFDLQGKEVLDLGCGGGIYSKALAELGAASVVGMDFSESMLEGARSDSTGYNHIHYHKGDALHTGLIDGDYDFILQRALIHHMKDLDSCFKEAYRLLRPGGHLMIQDRTPEDCLLPGSSTHIRGYFNEMFPHLGNVELGRRHEGHLVEVALKLTGFSKINETKLWEVRQVYSGMSELRTDLLQRKGRSILHELSDSELEELAKYIEVNMQNTMDGTIVERDRWTIWTATKERES